jgi:selenocysteine lyase/cysteine desulfurase
MQNYCQKITQKPIEKLQELGCILENEAFRASHLLGITLPSSIDNQAFTEKLSTNKIFVSNRGVAIRISQNVYNTEADLWKLVEILKAG